MAETPPFLDTNILLRHLLQDDPDQSPRATAYLERVERGEVTVRTDESVVMETVFTLQRQYRIPKPGIREGVMAIIQLPNVQLPAKQIVAEVFDVYVDRNLSFIDAYHAVMMPRWGLDTIVSFDRGFDRLPGIKRIEP